MSSESRRRGFSFLSFFLGILLGIILILGAVGGVAAYVLLMDADTVFETVGLDNSKDENGKNKLVNTDVDNGGVKNMWELITKVTELAGDFDNKTIGDFENLMPVAGGLVDTVHGMLSEYIELDKEEVKAVKFSEFGDYVQDVVLDVQPAAVMEKCGMDVSGNELFSAILCGAEADYVEVEGVKYPVRLQNSGEEGAEDVYFYTATDGKNYTVTKTDDVYTATQTEFAEYDAEKAKLSGNFYYENADTNGEKIVENPVTLRTFSDGGDALEPLNKIKVIDFVDGADDTVTKVLGDITVGQLISGDADFKGMIDGLALGDFMDVSPDSAIMSYLGYGVIDLKKDETTGLYSGTYKKLATGELPAEEIACFVEANGTKITRAYYLNEANEEVDIKGTTISEVSKRIDGVTNDIKIGQLMTIDSGNKLLNAVKNSTVKSLANDIQNLTINELYAKEIYGGRDIYKIEQSSDFNPAYVYYKQEEDGTYTYVGKVTDWEEGLFTYGEPTALWKIMLYTYTGDVGTEATYTVNNITEMITNVTNNIDNATLRELCTAGILKLEDDQLEKKINGQEIGSMKLGTVLAALIDTIPSETTNPST